jgi:type I restriction enzyme R subunit
LSNDYHEKRKQIIDTMIKDATMRHKAKLIDGFIRQNVDNDKENFEKSKADGSMDLESRLTNYITEARNKAVKRLAFEEEIEEQALTKFLSEYDYLQREKPEIIQEAINQKKIGFKERRNLQKRILEKLRTIIEMFNWE